MHQWYYWTDDGVRHYVVELGDGPTIVVLHGGWGGEHSYLLDLVQPLAAHFRFVLYDQRGSLRSPAADETVSLGRLVFDLEELRRELGNDPLTLLTHSMGSQLAYAYLREYPSQVRAMVMLGPVIPEDAIPDVELEAQAHEKFVEFAQANEAKQLKSEGLDGRSWESLTAKEKSARNQISFASGNIFHIERWRQLKGGQVFHNGRIYPLLRENTSPEDWDGLLEALKAGGRPVHLIMGDHDLSDFGAVSWPRLVEVLPEANLTVIEQAGHNAWIDQPVEVQAVLTRTLSAATRTGADPGGDFR
jgi:pimeloyl-ACP methyl ester carboxylesterase